MKRSPNRMDSAHRFKLGLFAPNCSGGLAMTRVPERWDASWDNNVTIAGMADEGGLDFLLPIARWHGYRGDTNTEGSSFEALTWASGMLAVTREISVFSTIHVPFINPVYAAKQIVTADHIGKGRFGLNIVSGWNEGEFGMFGAELLEHDARYDYSQEWLDIATRIWTETEPFDFKGRYFDMTDIMSDPKPYGGERPLVMSAGSSPAGRAFAARHADCLFMIIVDEETLVEETAAVRASVAGRPRVGIYCSGHVVCRPTQKEAEDYHHYYVHEMGDWEAADHLVRIRQPQQESFPSDRLASIKERLVGGLATFPVVGNPDHVADAFRRLSESGLDGMAFGLVNYIDELPLVRDELLPRLERLGLREARAGGA